MDHKVVFLVISLVFGNCVTAIEEKIRDPDIDLTVPQLIAKYGYPAESHIINTEDGYALEVHRIPHGRNDNVRGNRPVVFLQHGLTASSSCWILTGTEKSLGYILADAGYDVWFGNSRGNFYSRLKTPVVDPDKNDYWKFSWHEGGVHDLPAVIDYILKKTGEEKIFYIGHSMGTTMFYVMASERPEYNDKIKLMVSLAPVAYMSHIKNKLVKMLSPAASEIGWLLNLMGIYEFLPKSGLLKELGQSLCSEKAKYRELCENVAFLIMGADAQNLNVSKIPFFLNNLPQGSSTRMFVHYGQEVESAKFRRYDHGWLGNLVKYGSIAPPNYATNKISAPIALFYGDHDDLADPVDVKQLHEELPNSTLIQVPQEGFTHLDFIIHNNIRELLYDKILQLFELHRSK